MTPDDGCSAICDIEVGWECLTPGQPCQTVCGDGILKGTEDCDDNSNDGVGCMIGCIGTSVGFDCS